MPARKKPTYQKLNTVPRVPGEKLIARQVIFRESDLAWLNENGGITEVVRKLIRDARQWQPIETGVVAKPIVAEPVPAPRKEPLPSPPGPIAKKAPVVQPASDEDDFYE